MHIASPAQVPQAPPISVFFNLVTSAEYKEPNYVWCMCIEGKEDGHMDGLSDFN